jgi:hypothetical protein
LSSFAAGEGSVFCFCEVAMIESRHSMRLKTVVAIVAIAMVLYVIGAVTLGSLGMDIHWRGFH